MWALLLWLRHVGENGRTRSTSDAFLERELKEKTGGGGGSGVDWERNKF